MGMGLALPTGAAGDTMSRQTLARVAALCRPVGAPRAEGVLAVACLRTGVASAPKGSGSRSHRKLLRRAEVEVSLASGMARLERWVLCSGISRCHRRAGGSSRRARSLGHPAWTELLHRRPTLLLNH